jgi:hypothetical protein
MKPVSDFTFYWYAAQQFVTGHTPYIPMPGRQYVILNPPWALTLLFPLGFMSLAVAQVVWLLVLTTIFLLSAMWLWKVYGEGRSPVLALVLVVAFTPVWVTFKLGQTTPFVLLGLSGFLRYQEKRPWLGGAFLFFAAFKPQLAFLIWPALLLLALFENQWKPLFALVGMLIVTTLAVLAVRPDIFVEYSAMLRTQRAGFYETSTIATILRQATGLSWTQFVPAMLALAWFAWRWKSRRSLWNWNREMPMLLLVSLVTTTYAWFTDEVILLPAVFAAAAALGKLGARWEPSAVLYLLLNMIGMEWAVAHHISWLTLIPIVWLVFYLTQIPDARHSI